MTRREKIVVRKYGGDDAYSWAVFVDGHPTVTGCSKTEAAYHKRKLVEMYAARQTG